MAKKGVLVDGEKVQNLRRSFGFSQTELGERAMHDKGGKKISIRTIQKIENDPSFLCSLRMVENLAKVFDLPTEELFVDNSFQLSDEKIDETVKSPYFFDASNYDNFTHREFGEILKFDGSVKFEIFENVISHLRKLWGEDEDVNGLAWDDCNEEKIQIINILRKFKFVPTSFDDLSDAAGGLDESVFRLFCKHAVPRKTWEKTSWGIHDEKAYDNLSRTSYSRDSAFRFKRELKDIFNQFSKAHFYSIDYDLPENQEIMEIMSEFIERIEKYFEGKCSIAEEVRFKFYFSFLMEKLEAHKISIFTSMKLSKKIGVGKNQSQVNLSAFHMRILIRSWENEDVQDYYCCRDEYLHQIYDSFTSVTWRSFYENEIQDEKEFAEEERLYKEHIVQIVESDNDQASNSK